MKKKNDKNPNENHPKLIENSITDDFINAQQQGYQEILNALLEGDDNLDLKTHINNPKALAGLNLIGNMLERAGYSLCANTIYTFINTYLRYMISYKRLSRKEIIQALGTVSANDINQLELKDKFFKRIPK